MNRSEYNTYQTRTPREPRIRASMFGDGRRTLCVGYHIDRSGIVVELCSGELRVYTNDKLTTQGPSIHPILLRPGKRAYVERTDLLFAIAMQDAGFELTFTTPNWPDEEDSDEAAS